MTDKAQGAPTVREPIRKPLVSAETQPAAATAAPETLMQRALDDPGQATPEAIRALQQAAGNQAVTRWLQTKLMVGPAGDRYEQEADRVAEQVLNMPTPTAHGVQRDEADEDEDPEQPEEPEAEPDLQAKAAGPDTRMGFRASEAVERRIKSSQGAGAPLPGELRASMEQRFGADFSSVHVHADAESAAINRELHAQAFAHGQDIFLGDGKYSPGTTAGQRLLAHELTHVLQQGGATRRRPPSAEVQRTLMTAKELQQAAGKGNWFRKLNVIQVKHIKRSTYENILKRLGEYPQAQTTSEKLFALDALEAFVDEWLRKNANRTAKWDNERRRNLALLKGQIAEERQALKGTTPPAPTTSTQAPGPTPPATRPRRNAIAPPPPPRPRQTAPTQAPTTSQTQPQAPTTPAQTQAPPTSTTPSQTRARPAPPRSRRLALVPGQLEAAGLAAIRNSAERSKAAAEKALAAAQHAPTHKDQALKEAGMVVIGSHGAAGLAATELTEEVVRPHVELQAASVLLDEAKAGAAANAWTSARTSMREAKTNLLADKNDPSKAPKTAGERLRLIQASAMLNEDEGTIFDSNYASLQNQVYGIVKDRAALEGARAAVANVVAQEVIAAKVAINRVAREGAQQNLATTAQQVTARALAAVSEHAARAARNYVETNEMVKQASGKSPSALLVMAERADAAAVSAEEAARATQEAADAIIKHIVDEVRAQAKVAGKVHALPTAEEQKSLRARSAIRAVLANKKTLAPQARAAAANAAQSSALSRSVIQEQLTGPVNSRFALLGKLIESQCSKDGDSSKLEVSVKVPVDPSAIGFIGFNIVGQAERDGGSVKVRLEAGISGGGQLPIGLTLSAELGGYLEAQGRSGAEVMNLISYGLYRRFRESSLVPREVTNYLWGMGGQSGETRYDEAEAFGHSIEDNMGAQSYVEMGGYAGGKAEYSNDLAIGGLKVGLGASAGARFTTGLRYDKKIVEGARGKGKGQAVTGRGAQSSVGKWVGGTSFELKSAFGPLEAAGNFDLSWEYAKTSGEKTRLLGAKYSVKASGKVPGGSLVNSIAGWVQKLADVTKRGLMMAGKACSDEEYRQAKTSGKLSKATSVAQMTFGAGSVAYGIQNIALTTAPMTWHTILGIPAVGQEVVQGLTASSLGIELSVEGSRERGEGWKNAFIIRKTSETGLEALSYLKIKRSTSSLLYKHTFSAPDQT